MLYFCIPCLDQIGVVEECPWGCSDGHVLSNKDERVGLTGSSRIVIKNAQFSVILSNASKFTIPNLHRGCDSKKVIIRYMYVTLSANCMSNTGTQGEKLISQSDL